MSNKEYINKNNKKQSIIQNIKIKKSNNYNETISNIFKQIISYQYGNDDYQNKLFPIRKYPYLQYNNNPNYNIQLSNPRCSFLTKAHLISLENNLQSYEQYKDMKLLYTLTKNGASLRTLYDKAKGYHSLIIFIKDDKGNIFWGYSNEGLQCRPNKFYGNGETFLFSFYTGVLYSYLFAYRK